MSTDKLQDSGSEIADKKGVASYLKETNSMALRLLVGDVADASVARDEIRSRLANLQSAVDTYYVKPSYHKTTLLGELSKIAKILDESSTTQVGHLPDMDKVECDNYLKTTEGILKILGEEADLPKRQKIQDVMEKRIDELKYQLQLNGYDPKERATRAEEFSEMLVSFEKQKKKTESADKEELSTEALVDLRKKFHEQAGDLFKVFKSIEEIDGKTFVYDYLGRKIEILFDPEPGSPVDGTNNPLDPVDSSKFRQLNDVKDETYYRTRDYIAWDLRRWGLTIGAPGKNAKWTGKTPFDFQNSIFNKKIKTRENEEKDSNQYLIDAAKIFHIIDPNNKKIVTIGEEEALETLRLLKLIAGYTPAEVNKIHNYNGPEEKKEKRPKNGGATPVIPGPSSNEKEPEPEVPPTNLVDTTTEHKTDSSITNEQPPMSPDAAPDDSADGKNPPESQPLDSSTQEEPVTEPASFQQPESVSYRSSETPHVVNHFHYYGVPPGHYGPPQQFQTEQSTPVIQTPDSEKPNTAENDRILHLFERAFDKANFVVNKSIDSFNIDDLPEHRRELKSALRSLDEAVGNITKNNIPCSHLESDLEDLRNRLLRKRNRIRKILEKHSTDAADNKRRVELEQISKDLGKKFDEMKKEVDERQRIAAEKEKEREAADAKHREDLQKLQEAHDQLKLDHATALENQSKDHEAKTKQLVHDMTTDFTQKLKDATTPKDDKKEKKPANGKDSKKKSSSKGWSAPVRSVNPDEHGKELLNKPKGVAYGALVDRLLKMRGATKEVFETKTNPASPSEPKPGEKPKTATPEPQKPAAEKKPEGKKEDSGKKS